MVAKAAAYLSRYLGSTVYGLSLPLFNLLYFPFYAKRLRIIARVVIDFTPYIPFRKSR